MHKIIGVLATKLIAGLQKCSDTELQILARDPIIPWEYIVEVLEKAWDGIVSDRVGCL